MLVGIIVFILLGVMASLVNIAQWRRGRSVSERWRAVSGRVLEFGVTHRTPEVLYEYEVGGVRYESRNLVPGIRKIGTGGYLPMRRTYLEPDGCLRYPPGKVLTVYHHPDDPTDVTLYPGSGMKVWAWPLLTLIVGGGALMGYDAGPEFWRSHRDIAIISGLFLAAALLVLLGFSQLLTHLRSRDFSSTEGRLLEASAVSPGLGKSADRQLVARYEYSVEGVRYHSRQLGAVGATQRDRRERVEEQAAALVADPKVRVWYDPRAPWNCFLWQARLGMVLLPFAMAAVLAGIGAFALGKF